MTLKHALVALLATAASAIEITVGTAAKAGSDNPYGLMHEDINYSGDGGLYAELIQNRAFQGSPKYPVSLTAYSAVGGARLSLQNLTKPLSAALKTSLHVAAPATVEGGTPGKVGFANSGYFGINVAVQKYKGTFYVKGNYSGAFTASLQSALAPETYGSVEVPSLLKGADEWVKHTFELTPTKAAPQVNNTFSITFDASKADGAALDFNFISLFPPTYKNRPNGLRPDIMEAFAKLKPKFLRWPGGNMLMGNDIATRWKWNETILPLIERPGFDGVWGYPQTNGLGVIEYMEWCDDQGLEAIVGVWDGLALDGGNITEADIDFYVQDALDEISFLTEPATGKWGAKRAALGHPKPWKVKYVEIGNEDWLAGRPVGWQTYKDYRFPAFLKAFNKKFPEITVIASGAFFDGHDIPVPAVGDYHQYSTPDAMVESYTKFDTLNSSQPHIVGEYGVVHPNGGLSWSGPQKQYPFWGGAVGEAVFLIGTERNADRIRGTTYAPVLRSLDKWSWAPCMIMFGADPKLTTLSTSWHALEIISTNPLTHVLNSTADARAGPVYWVAGKNTDKNVNLFKVAVYNSTTPTAPVTVKFPGVAAGASATLFTLRSTDPDPYAYNDPYGKSITVKATTTIKADDAGVFKLDVPNMSIAVLEIKIAPAPSGPAAPSGPPTRLRVRGSSDEEEEEEV